MRAGLFYRIAAVVSLLFAVGHTVGFLTFRPKAAAGQAAMRAMAVVSTKTARVSATRVSTRASA